MRDRAREAGLRWRDEVARWDLEDEAPYHDVVRSMADYNLLGLTMPSRYGGQDLTALDYVLVVEELFRQSQHWITGEPTFCSTGPGPSLILLADDEATREKFLPDVVAGRKACGIALTEPDHGSDLTHLEASAVLDGDEYVLNGSKRFITGCPINELYTTFVRFDGIPAPRGSEPSSSRKGRRGCASSAAPASSAPGCPAR